jgi:hypothetical protein
VDINIYSHDSVLDNMLYAIWSSMPNLWSSFSDLLFPLLNSKNVRLCSVGAALSVSTPRLNYLPTDNLLFCFTVFLLISLIKLKKIDTRNCFITWGTFKRRINIKIIYCITQKFSYAIHREGTYITRSKSKSTVTQLLTFWILFKVQNINNCIKIFTVQHACNYAYVHWNNFASK